MSAWGTLFPLTVSSWGASPSYLTDVTTGRNGQEVRNAVWQDPLYSFNAAFGVRSYADIETLMVFFHACKGREQSFLVKDWSDFKVARTAIGTGDGVETDFQLIKNYVHGLIPTYTRTITKPKAVEGVGGVRVWVDGVEALTTAFSFSSVTGIVTFGAGNEPPAGDVVEASVDEFYVPCRFDVDTIDVELLSYWVKAGADHSNVNVPDIRLREVRGE